jgi:prevent-host-death family protein
MSNAKVSELKAKLSAYLAEVRRGETVTVYDRNTAIAQVVPIQKEEDDLIIIEASAPPTNLKKIKGVRPKKPIDLDKLLRELRTDK